MKCQNNECEKTFESPYPHRRYCSKKCQTRYWTIKTVERRANDVKKFIEQAIQNHTGQ